MKKRIFLTLSVVLHFGIVVLLAKQNNYRALITQYANKVEQKVIAGDIIFIKIQS